MWFIIFLTLLVAENLSINVPLKYSKEWNQFKIQYKKKYLNDVDELNHLKTYIFNRRRILKHNKLYEQERVSYKQSINEFSDLTNEDFMKKMTGHTSSNISVPVRYNLKKRGHLRAEISKDWRNYGYVTRVKNQGSKCGSCWAFSVIGLLEGQYIKKTGKHLLLSEQNLIDCTKISSCNGGIAREALQYVQRNGINSEESYPYKQEKLYCEHNPNQNILKVNKFYTLPSGDEKALRDISSTFEPISVAIDANHDSMRYYSGGIYSEHRCNSSNLSHDVLLVGYGSERGHDYWIVKNSWGSSWGENGYIRIARNKNNMCGIATEPLIANIHVGRIN